jgi:hypothetical protein
VAELKYLQHALKLWAIFLAADKNLQLPIQYHRDLLRWYIHQITLETGIQLGEWDNEEGMEAVGTLWAGTFVENSGRVTTTAMLLHNFTQLKAQVKDFSKRLLEASAAVIASMPDDLFFGQVVERRVRKRKERVDSVLEGARSFKEVQRC